MSAEYDRMHEADNLRHQITKDNTVLYKFTREMAEGLAGRKITDEEAIRVAKAIEFSTVADCVSEAVFQVCGLADNEDSERAEGEAEGCTCCQTRAVSSVTGYECPRCGHLASSHGGAGGEMQLTLREVTQLESALDGEPTVVQSLAELLTGNPWDEIERCSECGANLADDAGEGYDGLCGSCADVAEKEGRWS
jgi:hypothetical protein